jgi:hypothetical protein
VIAKSIAAVIDPASGLTHLNDSHIAETAQAPVYEQQLSSSSRQKTAVSDRSTCVANPSSALGIVHRTSIARCADGLLGTSARCST